MQWRCMSARSLDQSIEVHWNVGGPHCTHLKESNEHAHTVSELARDELERLVKEDDGEGDLQDGNPLLQVERCDLKHGLHAAATQNMRYLRHVTCMFDTGPASVVEIARFSHRKKVDFEDDEVKRQREGHGTEQPVVVPGRHRHQRLVLRNTKQNTLYNYYEQV